MYIVFWEQESRHKMTEMVFVSYDHADADYATRIQHTEEKYLFFRLIYHIRIDSSAIRPGGNWRQEIENMVRSCNLFLLIASQEHFSTYVATEVGMALGAHKPILPLYVDSPQALVPYHLDHLQGVAFPKDLDTLTADMPPEAQFPAMLTAVDLAEHMARAMGTNKYNKNFKNVRDTVNFLGGNYRG